MVNDKVNLFGFKPLAINSLCNSMFGLLMKTMKNKIGNRIIMK